MATIRKYIDTAAASDDVWDVVSDIGAVHTRLAPDFVLDTVLEDGARIVKFANGFVARELILGVDHQLRRFAYSVVGGRAAHHNASFEVLALANGSARIVWTADVLPDSVAPLIESMMAQGSEVIRRTLDRQGA